MGVLPKLLESLWRRLRPRDLSAPGFPGRPGSGPGSEAETSAPGFARRHGLRGRRGRRGGAGRGGAERREEGSCRSSGRRPAAGLAYGLSLRLLPAPGLRPSVLPSPPVHDGNTMAAAAQFSLTQVTPPAGRPGSTRWGSPALPPPLWGAGAAAVLWPHGGSACEECGRHPEPEPEPRAAATAPPPSFAGLSAPPRAAPTGPPPPPRVSGLLSWSRQRPPSREVSLTGLTAAR